MLIHGTTGMGSSIIDSIANWFTGTKPTAEQAVPGYCSWPGWLLTDYEKQVCALAKTVPLGPVVPPATPPPPPFLGPGQTPDEVIAAQAKAIREAQQREAEIQAEQYREQVAGQSSSAPHCETVKTMDDLATCIDQYRWWIVVGIIGLFVLRR
jgi:hypothetical protein